MSAEHEFEDVEYVKSWAATADERRPQRPTVFAHIAALIERHCTPRPHVVELGCGPGALAEALLDRLPAMTYEGIDLSSVMLDLARERLARYGPRARLHRLDLGKPGWQRNLERVVDAIVTNQALHDLGSDEAVAATYRAALALLPPGGLLVNAELVVPADGSKPAKPGKLPLTRHLEMLVDAGFTEVRCDLDYGDYACLVARVPSAA